MTDFFAAGYGEDTSSEDVRLACLSVFGFGGSLIEDDEVETGLLGARMAMASKTTPDGILRVVLPRFGVVVSEKVLAQAAPVLGAVAEATINPVFTGYYQQMGHVHFRLRRPERHHDPAAVNVCFERVARAQREAGKE